MFQTAIPYPRFNDALVWARKYMPGITLRFRTEPQVILDGEQCDAVLEFCDGIHTIHFSRNVPHTQLLDTLIHELAHIIDNHRNGWADNHHDEHRESWGKEYARVYQDYWAWVTERKINDKTDS